MAPIIKKEHVSVTSVDPAAPRRRPGHAKVAELLRVDGQVRAIEVQCSCGERTVIELGYEAASEAPAPTASEAPAPSTPEDSVPGEKASEEERPL